MNGQTSEALLSLFDTARLNRRYWFVFSLLALITVLEFFDFLVVGFLVAVLGPQWQLTYGQSAVILYSGGVGAICGAIIWGALADAWGRKTPTRDRHVHLRRRCRGDRVCARPRLGFVRRPALRRGLRTDRRGDAVSDNRGGASADALPDIVVELLCGVRNRGHAGGVSDIRDAAVGARLAWRGDARRAAGAGGRRDRALGAGIGALAYRQGALRRGTRPGGAPTRTATGTSSAADDAAGRTAFRPPVRNCTISRAASGTR